MNRLETALDKRIQVLERCGLMVPDQLIELLPANNLNRLIVAPGQSNFSSFGNEGGAIAAQKSERSGDFCLGVIPPDVLTGGAQSNSSDLELSPDDILSCKYSGGFDGGCEVSYFGTFYPSSQERRAALFESLRSAKTRAQENGPGVKSSITFGSRVWVVQETGVRSKNQFNVFKYRLVSGGLTLLISDNDAEELPAARVVFGYESLEGHDFFEVSKEVRRELLSIGFKFDREVVSRVDLQVTLDLPFDLVGRAFAEGRIVSRVRKWSRYDRPASNGLVLGTLTGGQDLQICIYDKFRECVDKKQDDKLDFLYNASGQDSTNFLRVEFRLRRPALRAMDIDSVDDLNDRLSDVVDFLTSKWFRIVKDSKVRGRENKQELDVFWRRVQECFSAVFVRDREKKEPIKMRKRKSFDARALTRQGLGCLVKSIANATFKDAVPLSEEEFKNVFLRVFDCNLPSMYEDYKETYYNLKLMRDAVYLKDDAAPSSVVMAGGYEDEIPF